MSLNLGRINEAEHQLRRDFVEFSKLWAAVRDDWRDKRRERFEQEHLTTLGPSLNRFSAALQEFCEAATKADRALNDDRRPAEELD